MNKKKTERVFNKVYGIKGYLENIAKHGDKILYRYPKGKEYISLTYSEFVNNVYTLAKGLERLGLAGKRIAVIGETSPEWVCTYLAVMAGGGVIVPMDKELDIKEIYGLLNSVEAEAIVYGNGFNGKFSKEIEGRTTLKYFIPIAGEGNGEDIVAFSSVMELGANDDVFAVSERSDRELAVMLFTSGTTGTSKCVMLCERNIWSTVNAACGTVEFFPDDTICSVLPLHHTYELACMLSGMNYGMEIGINDSLMHIQKNFAEYKPTGLVLVPLFVTTLYGRIMQTAKKTGKYGLLRFMMKLSNALRHIGIDLRKKLFKSVLAAFGGILNKVVSGGAPLNPKMVKEFDAFGITIAEGYGITECSPLISVNPYYRLKSGSVGPAVPSCQVRIDGKDKNDKGFAEGEIQVKGDNVMIGYYNNPEENAKAFTEDGWYRTGDIGYMDGDGYIYITGRLKSVIVLENGKNVFPEEIEERLADIPEIGECVVVGRKAEDGETILLTAIVYPSVEIYGEAPDKERAYNEINEKILDLNRSLATFKRIKALEIREIPFEKTTSRKIKRHLVK